MLFFQDMILAAAAAVICDSSLEKWITDCEESDNSSLDDSAISRSDFSTCAQCKSINVNPLYRYCEKCYQVYIEKIPKMVHTQICMSFMFDRLETFSFGWRTLIFKQFCG